QTCALPIFFLLYFLYYELRRFSMAKNDAVDIKRINELAKKKKEEGLTESEAKEQSKLRKAYLDSFRDNFKKQIENTRVIDPEGNDVTTEKYKKILNTKDKKDNI